MKYQPIPKWDKNRPEFLKLGFIIALSFCFMAFNYTTYRNQIIYEPTIIETDEDVIEIPPVTVHQKKRMPPPPTPQIEELLEIEPAEEPEFIDEKPIEAETLPEDAKVVEKENVNPIITPGPAPDIVTREKEVEIDEIVSIADRMPVYSECSLDGDEAARRKCTSETIYTIANSEVKYPAIARQNEIEGTVVASFVVDKYGEVTDIKIVRDIGGGCGDAVVKAIKKFKKFYPGKHNGRPVKVIYRIPVKFKLR